MVVGANGQAGGGLGISEAPAAATHLVAAAATPVGAVFLLEGVTVKRSTWEPKEDVEEEMMGSLFSGRSRLHCGGLSGS
jgi:hypothetical protein